LVIWRARTALAGGLGTGDSHWQSRRERLCDSTGTCTGTCDHSENLPHLCSKMRSILIISSSLLLVIKDSYTVGHYRRRQVTRPLLPVITLNARLRIVVAVPGQLFPTRNSACTTASALRYAAIVRVLPLWFWVQLLRRTSGYVFAPCRSRRLVRAPAAARIILRHGCRKGGGTLTLAAITEGASRHSKPDSEVQPHILYLYVIDCSQPTIAAAIAASGIPRSQLHITSKLNVESCGLNMTQALYELVLDPLQTSYVDLLLLHHAGRFQKDTNPHPPCWDASLANGQGTYYNCRMQTVSAFESLRQQGLIRTWGVSNWNIRDLEVSTPDARRVLVQPFSDHVVFDVAAMQSDVWLLPAPQPNRGRFENFSSSASPCT
jgi:hypothetical protein